MKRVAEWGFGWTNTTCTSRGKYHWLEHGYRVDDRTYNRTKYSALWGYVFDKNELRAYACEKCLSNEREYLQTIEGQIQRLQVLLGRDDVTE